MSDEHTKPHPTIRTFAQDLAQAREKRGQSAPESSSSAAPKKDSVAQTKTTSHFIAQSPQKTTHKEPKIVVPHTPSPAKPREDFAHKHTTHKKLPAFHELQEKIDVVTTHSAPTDTSKQGTPRKIVPKISVNQSSKPPRTNIGYDATIITDTKHQRFNFFQSITQSLAGWFKTFTFSKKKASPVYTVPETQRRRGVIQKATSKSGSIFTADSAELRLKIRQRQKLAAAEKDAKSELSWSPYTDAGFALLESPEESAQAAYPHNVTVEFKQHIQPPHAQPTSQIPTVPPAPIAVPVPEIPAQAEPIERDPRWDNQKEVVSVVNNEPVPVPVPEPETEPVAVVEPEHITPTNDSQPAETAPTEPARLKIQSLNTNTLAMSIVAGLTSIVVLFFITKALIGYLTLVEPIVSYDTTSYLVSATPNQIVVGELNSITDIPLQAGTLLDIDYIDTQLFGQNGDIIPVETIISALKFNLSPSFLQSLSDVRFAQMYDSKPIIVLEFIDADTALGGLLAWESTMAENLKELYLIAQPYEATFSDKIINGRDIRLLKSANGEILVVYGIVSQDTVLITSSVEVFTQVVNTSFTD